MFWFVNDGGPLLIAPRRALGAWEGGDPSSAAGPSPSNGSTNQPDQRRTTTVRAQSGSQSGLSRLAKVGASKEPLCRALAGQGLRPAALRRRAGRPQVKRDPLGGADRSTWMVRCCALSARGGPDAVRWAWRPWNGDGVLKRLKIRADRLPTLLLEAPCIRSQLPLPAPSPSPPSPFRRKSRLPRIA